MKLLVIGIDALMPELVFNNLEDYPVLKKLVISGISGEYDGYVYGYGSHDNWTSLYTGLSPKEHQIIKGIYQPSGKLPRLYDYSSTETIWKILNENGYKVGMWKGLVTAPPEPIDGYMVSGELAFDEHFEDPEIAIDGHMLCEKDQHLIDLFEGEFPKRPTPKSPDQFGYTWEELFNNPQLVNNLLDENYFEEGYQYLKDMLDYSLLNIRKVNEKEKVDLFWFYNGIFDYLGHFTMHDFNRTQLKKAIKLVDDFVGEMLNIFQPENVIVLSDHGQKSFIDHFPNCDIELQKESFGLADQCLFLGDNILMQARTGGFLTSLHSLKGTMILNGENFKQGKLKGMRNLDVYPLILEMFDCIIPKNRKGLIHPVLNKEHLKNPEQQYKLHKPKVNEKVLIVQTCEVNVFNGYINDFYNENRFSNIFIFGKEKYRSVFLANQQVSGFYDMDQPLEKSVFDKVLVPYVNAKTKELLFTNIK
ncbi:alkaline phosphatase family protein [Psychrobacillus sp. NPDC096623]|uniref:alkaline phosphatase family protein n=1 Tax=Psychrobacillus sp. NPDC096623 TaxID=3364492 RepID=UPI00380F72A4